MKLPPLPEPLLETNGDVFGHENVQGYTADQLRERDRQIVELCISLCIKEEEEAREAKNWQAVFAAVQCGDALRSLLKETQ